MADQSLLTGVRVLDVSQYLPGPYSTQLLADMGAEVVKIEPPKGDPMRLFDGDTDDEAPGITYRMINAGKTVLRLDLKAAEDQVRFQALVREADILIESFRPGVMARLGFGPEPLRALNPSLVHVALTGWGYDGPYSQRAGHDLNYMAIAGGLTATGMPEQPAIPFPPASDMASGMMAALAALGGLWRAQASGQGMFLDVSIMETALAWQGFGLNAMADGKPVRRGQSLLSGGAACYQLYRTADDRWLSVGALEEKFWAAFCSALGQPDWVARQHSDPLPQTELIGLVSAVIAKQPLDHWLTVFADSDCCVEPVLDWVEIPTHPHVKARDQLQESDGQLDVLTGLRIDGQPPRPRHPFKEMAADQLLEIWGLASPAGN